MLSAVLDLLRGHADVTHTYVIGRSFGGHMALRCAVDDARIRGVIAANAPVSRFFADRAWQGTLSRITLDTLAHITGTTAETVGSHMRDWALSDPQLASLQIPVCYLVSRRDEVVPGSELSVLRNHVRHLYVYENDDLHCSPRHATETCLWAALWVLRMRQVRGLRRAAIGSALRARQARRLLAGRVAAVRGVF